MNQRDQISVSGQHILWVAGLGVGALTLAFVLGIQVGKNSASWRKPAQRSVEEELKELPEPLLDQLKIFEGEGPDKLVPAAKVEAAPAKEEPKPEAKPAEKNPEPKPESWTLQLIATTDAGEAKRVAAKAKAAGFPTATLKEKGQWKVRLTTPAERAVMDKNAEKLKKAGVKSSPVKVE